jgi:hypothetical protein
MQTKRLRQPPAQRCRQRRFVCQDEKMLPLQRENPRRRVLMKAQLDGQLLLDHVLFVFCPMVRTRYHRN